MDMGDHECVEGSKVGVPSQFGKRAWPKVEHDTGLIGCHQVAGAARDPCSRQHRCPRVSRLAPCSLLSSGLLEMTDIVPQVEQRMLGSDVEMGKTTVHEVVNRGIVERAPLHHGEERADHAAVSDDDNPVLRVLPQDEVKPIPDPIVKGAARFSPGPGDIDVTQI